MQKCRVLLANPCNPEGLQDGEDYWPNSLVQETLSLKEQTAFLRETNKVVTALLYTHVHEHTPIQGKYRKANIYFRCFY